MSTSKRFHSASDENVRYLEIALRASTCTGKCWSIDLTVHILSICEFCVFGPLKHSLKGQLFNLIVKVELVVETDYINTS